MDPQSKFRLLIYRVTWNESYRYWLSLTTWPGRHTSTTGIGMVAVSPEN